MIIGIIGAGKIGGILATKFVAAGHDVRIANSRGPETLCEEGARTGATPATVQGAVEGADAVIIAVPYKAITALPADLFVQARANLSIIDTGNYYPARDGTISALDADLTDTEWVSRYFGRPVMKAFNSISANSLAGKGQPRGARQRIALPVASDDTHGKTIACQLVDEAGFDPVDAGSLANSWRQQPGTGAYTTDLDIAHLRIALDRLDAQDRALLPERREDNLKMILSLADGPGSAEAVRRLRALWDLPANLQR